MTQAEVNDTNPEAQQPSAAVENAQDPSLDSLLSEYDETPKEAPQQESQPSATQPTADMQAFMDRQIQKETTQAINESAKALRDAVGDTNLSERWFEGQLHVAANQDSRIMSAFNNRENNPGAWDSILNALGKELSKEINQAPTDSASTDSWNAVEASVHSASTSKVTESAPNYGAMTDAEFFSAKAKLR